MSSASAGGGGRVLLGMADLGGSWTLAGVRSVPVRASLCVGAGRGCTGGVCSVRLREPWLCAA